MVARIHVDETDRAAIPQTGETLLTRHLDGWLGSRARPIPPSQLLCETVVFAPHPDDECLGCGATILRLTDSAVPVHLVVMTDGEAMHRGLIAPDALAASRRAELHCAADKLGIPAGAVHRLGFRDSALSQDHAQAVDRVADILQAVHANQILLPYRHDRHRDHEATNRIVRAALARLDRPARLLEYPVWLWDHWPWTRPWRPGRRQRLHAVASAPRAWWQMAQDFRHRVDVIDLLPRKREALECHASQMTRPDGVTEWIILPEVAHGRWLPRFFSGFELFHTVDFE